MWFLTNLRPLTVEPAFRAMLRPSGYLVPPNALTAATKHAARSLRRQGSRVAVDNGLFDNIGDIADRFRPRADRLAREIDEVATKLGRRPLRRDLPRKLRMTAGNLAADVARVTADNQGPLSLADQLALRPTIVIGNEDITAATWLRLGLDRNVLDIDRDVFRRRNRRVAQQAAAVLNDGGLEEVTYLPVASAVDYDTAFDAGLEFAAAGLHGAAMGFGAYMADNSFTIAMRIANRDVKLARPLPQRYLRTALPRRR
jgi:hypothetical protein